MSCRYCFSMITTRRPVQHDLIEQLGTYKHRANLIRNTDYRYICFVPFINNVCFFQDTNVIKLYLNELKNKIVGVSFFFLLPVDYFIKFDPSKNA